MAILVHAPEPTPGTSAPESAAPDLMPSDAVEIPRPDFLQLAWDERLAGHAAARAREWLAEDLGCECDWTSVWLVPDTAVADLLVTARAEGLIAGLPLGPIVAAMVDEAVRFEPLVAEGSRVTPGDAVARLAGPVRDVLTIERTLLNALGRMSGVATATAELVREAAGRACRVYDTRKTVPGWRMLDKYAVRVGGGWNHRLGLADAILIKDNHLAELRREGFGAAEAVRRARGRMQAAFPPRRAASTVVEVELDRLDEFREVLEAGPDVVLLDNMPPPAPHGSAGPAGPVGDPRGLRWNPTGEHRRGRCCGRRKDQHRLAHPRVGLARPGARLGDRPRRRKFALNRAKTPGPRRTQPRA